MGCWLMSNRLKFYCGPATFDEFQESIPPSLRFRLPVEEGLREEEHILVPLKNVGIEVWPVLICFGYGPARKV